MQRQAQPRTLAFVSPVEHVAVVDMTCDPLLTPCATLLCTPAVPGARADRRGPALASSRAPAAAAASRPEGGGSQGSSYEAGPA